VRSRTRSPDPAGGGIDQKKCGSRARSGRLVSYSDSGGGIFNYFGTVTVTSSTLAGNSAGLSGGIYIYQGAVLLRNTIVAGNHTIRGGPDVNGAVDPASSYNLIGNGIGMTGISDGVNHNRVGTSSFLDPRLAPLSDYGGPTQTMPLLASSIALDTGDPALAGSPTSGGWPAAAG
jgi:hypothetical protein